MLCEFLCLFCYNNLKAFIGSQDSSTKLSAAQKKHANGSGSRQQLIGRVPSKGPMKQKLHPGMLSTQDRATAHYGAVTRLKATEDGMYLLSAGCFSITCYIIELKEVSMQ